MGQAEDKELEQLKNRLYDLADRSYTQGVFTFTGFLGLSEADVFWREEQHLRYAGVSVSGGFESADRVMIRFGKEEELGYSVPFPFVCINISPLNMKFADELSHRDFLGALMNLGIERSTLGDIKVGEKQAYLFCQDSVADYICSNLTQVKHTSVSCMITDDPADLLEEEPDRVTVQVQSLRADAVLSKVYNLSREKSLELFRQGKVYINGRLCENNSRAVKAGDTLNARGFGKCILLGDGRETRKGKLAIEVGVYR